MSAGAVLAKIWFRGRRSTRTVRAGVLIPNPNDFHRKKQCILDGGLDKLQVIADFDRTITKSFVNGKRGASCHGVMESLQSLSDEYREATEALFNKYFPIETSPNLTKEEKIPIMTEWYGQAHALLLKEGITEEHISSAVRTANLELREGWPQLMQTLQSHQVPLLVFSAGIANVIHEVFAQKFGNVSSTTHIISNWLSFSDTGCVEGISEPLIHMFNKDSRHTKGTDYHKSVEARCNVILLGDGLGDITMAEGISHNEVLKVGFLNDSVDKLLPKYTDVFDVIIVNDGSMEFVNDLIREIR
eukprot:gene7218-8600_t